MSAVVDAARHLLSRVRWCGFEWSGARVIAAAAAIVEKAGRGAGFDAATEMMDPALALVTAASAEAVVPAARRARILAIGRSVPLEERRDVLACAEPFLGRIDPGWAWSVILDLLTPEDVAAHGSLGLVIAAYASERGADGRLSAEEIPRGLPYVRQLAADELARAATSGEIRSAHHPAFAPLRESPPGRNLTPWEAGSYLASAAAVDPEWGLDVANGLLQTHAPGDLQAAIQLAARAAERAGLKSRILELARRPDFVAVQACWTLAAGSSGALAGSDLLEQVKSLVPRVADELDPGRELVAGLPLILALAYQGASEHIAELAIEWRIPPPLLVDEIFHAEALRGASGLQSGTALRHLLQIPEDAWSSTHACSFSWWLSAGPPLDERLAVCRSVLALAADPPWSPLPGSLADIVGWSRTGTPDPVE